MDKRTQTHGQALVETALALPVLGLALAAAALLIAYGHNLICLQLMAGKAARRMTAETPTLIPVALPHPLWGRVTVPSQRRTEQQLDPWRPFQGLATTVQAPGHLMSIQIKSQISPGLGFSRKLPILMQRATAETLLEPPRPTEN